MGEAYVAVLGDLQEEVLAVKETVAELLPVAVRSLDVRVDAKKKFRSLETELSILKHKEASFDGAMNAGNKEVSAARLEYATLGWIRDEVLSRLKMLKTDLEKSLKVASEWTTDDSSTISKQLDT